MTDEQLVLQALAEAEKGLAEGGLPIGSVLADRSGEIVARGHNMRVQTGDPTAHAEMNAIRKASKKLGTFDLSGCEIYTTCMPCPMCLGAIKWSNIKIVYYGASSKDADAIGFRDEEFYEKDVLELNNIDREACLEPFKAWSTKEDRIIY